MTTWNGPIEDYTKLSAGDIILDGEFRNPAYVEEIRVRDSHNPRIIHPEVRVSLYGYVHEFQHIDSALGTGYSFDCFEDGTMPEKDISDWNTPFATWADYVASIANHPEYAYRGIKVYSNSFNVPATIRCEGHIRIRHGNQLKARIEECNATVYLEMVMTNTCERCHTDYNSSGQRLAPREQWGWDTGESLSEILSSDFGINERAEDRAMQRTVDGDY